jgi:hypothetical protein
MQLNPEIALMPANGMLQLNNESTVTSYCVLNPLSHIFILNPHSLGIRLTRIFRVARVRKKK